MQKSYLRFTALPLTLILFAVCAGAAAALISLKKKQTAAAVGATMGLLIAWQGWTNLQAGQDDFYTVRYRAPFRIIMGDLQAREQDATPEEIAIVTDLTPTGGLVPIEWAARTYTDYRLGYRFRLGTAAELYGDGSRVRYLITETPDVDSLRAMGFDELVPVWRYRSPHPRVFVHRR